MASLSPNCVKLGRGNSTGTVRRLRVGPLLNCSLIPDRSKSVLLLSKTPKPVSTHLLCCRYHGGSVPGKDGRVVGAYVKRASLAPRNSFYRPYLLALHCMTLGGDYQAYYSC